MRQSAPCAMSYFPDEFAANDAQGYIAIVSSLANNLEYLSGLRAGLPQRLVASPVCDAVNFTRQLECAF